MTTSDFLFWAFIIFHAALLTLLIANALQYFRGSTLLRAGDLQERRDRVAADLREQIESIDRALDAAHASEQEGGIVTVSASKMVEYLEAERASVVVKLHTLGGGA